MGAALVIAVGYIAATETAKAWFYRTRRRKRAGG